MILALYHDTKFDFYVASRPFLARYNELPLPFQADTAIQIKFRLRGV